MAGCSYVLAVLGTSPAVLTELLWWLVQEEEQTVQGVEVWTTAFGLQRLQAATDDGVWDDLNNHISAPVPRPSAVVVADLEHGAAVRAGFSVRLFQSADGGSLDDIRSAQDAEQVSAQLYERVRTLRAQLRSHVQLVGSLAGGRKTMSSSLQSAFSLQAGPGDRLVHVLVHSKIETDRERLASFYFPNEVVERDTGVPVRDQVQVYDVRFPLVGDVVLSPALLEDLQQKPYADLWPQVRAAREARAATAELDLRPGGWTLTVGTGPSTITVRLGLGCGALYWALSEAVEPLTDVEWTEWLREDDRIDRVWGHRRRPRLDAESAANFVSDLRAELQAHLGVQWPDFLLVSSRTRPPKRSIPAADRVRGPRDTDHAQ